MNKAAGLLHTQHASAASLRRRCGGVLMVERSLVVVCSRFVFVRSAIHLICTLVISLGACRLMAFSQVL